MDTLFANHALNIDGLTKVQRIREHFNTLLKAIEPDLYGGARWDSITRTKLEEACFYAVKCVCVQPANQNRNSPPIAVAVD